VNAGKSIHFGHFVRAWRIEQGLTIRKMAAAVGITEPRWIAYEKMPKPEMYDSTFGRIAKAMGKNPDELKVAWESTPVLSPPETQAADPAERLRSVRATAVASGLPLSVIIEDLQRLDALAKGKMGLSKLDQEDIAKAAAQVDARNKRKNPPLRRKTG
jgi:transcriptional regulator with XRE-family HTH domain